MRSMHAALDTPPPAAPVRALVLARWNSWVQVWFPDTDEREWIDLRETAFAPLTEASEGTPGEDLLD